MKKTILILIVFLIIISVIILFLYNFKDMSLIENKVADNNSNLINNSVENISNDIQINDENCFKSNEFKCVGVTSGEKNPNSTIVCGCPPICNSGKFLITNLLTGKWPDGSLKAGYSCSYELPS
jgi:hypothetical protein